MKPKPKQESDLAMLEQLPDDALVTPREAAAVLRVAPGTLSIWRWRVRNHKFANVKAGKAKYDVPHVTIGALVRYRMRDLRAFRAKPEINGPVGVVYRNRSAK